MSIYLKRSASLYQCKVVYHTYTYSPVSCCATTFHANTVTYVDRTRQPPCVIGMCCWWKIMLAQKSLAGKHVVTEPR